MGNDTRTNQDVYVSKHSKIFYKGATSLLDTINSWEGSPNLIILQYFFSDFHKHSSNLQVIGFIDRLVDYINKRAKTLLLTI